MNKSLFSVQVLMSTAIIASLYILFTILLMNNNLAMNTLRGNYGFGYKIQILFSLIRGMWTSMSSTGLGILALTAVLTGANLSLLSLKMRNLTEQGRLRLVAGGSSLLGIAGSGCVACGLPLLAILGFGGSLAYLPLKGLELSYLSVLVLLFSLYLLVKANHRQACTISDGY